MDPVNKVLKGEIPWSQELRPEAKNFKTFFVHTVSRHPRMQVRQVPLLCLSLCLGKGQLGSSRCLPFATSQQTWGELGNA